MNPKDNYQEAAQEIADALHNRIPITLQTSGMNEKEVMEIVNEIDQLFRKMGGKELVSMQLPSGTIVLDYIG